MDKDVGRKIGRSKAAVTAKRQQLEIAAIGKRPWRPEDDRLLGTRPDDQVAMLLGRTIEAVKQRRCSFGLKPVNPKFISRKWVPAELKLLGVKADTEVAAQLGRTVSSVRTKRLGLGIRFQE